MTEFWCDRCARTHGLTLTPRQYEALVAYAQTGTAKLAAARMGITVRTIRNHLAALHCLVGVSTTIDLYRELGWLKVPDD